MLVKNALLSLTLLTSLVTACSVSHKGNDDGKQPAAEEPAGEKPAGKEPASEKPADEKPLDEKPANNEKPAEEKPADVKPVEEGPGFEPPHEEQPTIAAQLLGEWTLDVCSSDQVILERTFTETTLTDTVKFLASDCSATDYKIGITRSYSINAASAPMTIDYGMKEKAKVSVYTAEGVKVANEQAFLGRTDWVIGDVIEEEIQPDEESRLYDIFRLEDGKLYFGSIVGEASPEKRPTEFDLEAAFIKSSH